MPTESLATRISLVEGLRHLDDQEVWQRFIDTYQDLLLRIAFRAGLRESEAMEIVQDTAISVARSIQNYRYDPSRCSFKSWLHFLARRRISDHLRKKARDPMKDVVPLDVESYEQLRAEAAQTVPDTQWENHWRESLVRLAIDRAKSCVSSLQFQLFEAYVLREKSPSAVAKAFDVSVGRVYLAKYRVTRAIRSIIEQLEDARW